MTNYSMGAFAMDNAPECCIYNRRPLRALPGPGRERAPCTLIC